MSAALLENLLSCPVSFDRYDDSGVHVPYQLQCGHTICLFCIKQLAHQQEHITSISCPECRHETKTISDLSITSALRPNYTILGLISQQQLVEREQKEHDLQQEQKLKQQLQGNIGAELLLCTIKQYQSNVEITSLACGALQKMVKNIDQDTRITDSGLETLLSVLNKYQENGTLMDQVCGTLTRMVLNNENQFIITQSGTFDVLLKILQLHQNNRTIIEKACVGLMRICEVVNNINCPRGVELLFNVIRLYRKFIDVVQPACGVLYKLIGDDQKCINFKISGDDIIVLWRVIRQYQFDPVLTESIFSLLFRFGLFKIAKAYDIELLFRGIKIYQSNIKYMQQAYGMLEFVDWDSENIAAVIQCGGVELLLGSIKQHHGNIDLMKNIFGIMLNLLANTNVKIFITQDGGIEMLVNIIKQHYENTSLMFYACKILWIISTSTDNKIAVVRADGVNALLSIIKHQHNLNTENNPDLLKTVCGLIWGILKIRDTENHTTLNLFDGIEILLRVMDRHDKVKGVVLQARGVLNELIGRSGGTKSLLDVVNQFQYHTGIAIQALEILFSMVQNVENNTNISNIRRAGGIEIILKVINKHFNSDFLVYHSFAVLCKIVVHDDDKIAFGIYGIKLTIRFMVQYLIASRNLHSMYTRVPVQMQNNTDFTNVMENTQHILYLTCTLLRNISTTDNENRLSISREGGIEALLDVITYHKSNTIILCQACQAIGAIAMNTEAQITISRFSGVKILLGIITQHRTNTEINGIVCGALWNSIENIDNMVAFNQSNGIELLMDVIKQYQENTHVMEKVFGLLAVLSTNDESKVALAKYDIKIVVDVMKKHKDNINIVRQTLFLLLSILSSDNYKDTIGHILPTILVVMKNHKINAKISDLACKVLFKVSSFDGNLIFPRFDGIQVLLDTVNQHQDHFDLTANTCSILCNLARNKCNSVTISELGGIQILLRILTQYQDDSHLTKLSCSALWNIAVTQNNKDIIIKLGGTELILSIVKKHQNNADVIFKLFETLYILSSDTNKKVVITRHCDVELLIDLLKKYQDNGGIMEQVCWLISSISENKDNSIFVTKCEITELLFGALKQFQDNVNIITAVFSLLWNINCIDYIGEHNKVESLVNLIEQHQDNDIFMEQSCGTLRKISMQFENKVIECGGITLLLNLMKLHRDNVVIMQHVCKIFVKISLSDNNQVVIGKSGGIEILLDMMKQNQIHTDLIDLGCKILTNLSKNSDNRVTISKYGGIKVLFV